MRSLVETQTSRYQRIVRSTVLPLVLLGLCSCAPSESDVYMYDVVLQGGRVMDPESGLDGVRNVGIKDGHIEAVSQDPLVGTRTIDATGLVVAPGFIDLHVHGQNEESFSFMVRDGVTTGLELEVGTGDVAQWYSEREGGQLANYGVSVGHIPVRMIVMEDPGDWLPRSSGGSEPATAEHIAEMARLTEEGLKQGALAVGFGLAYTPAATTDEFETILQKATSAGATAHIHVRGDGPEDSPSDLTGLTEAIESASETGTSLHVVHANSSGGSETVGFLAMIEKARANGQDITTEAYPYEAGQTRIESALFDDWETWNDDQFKIHQWVKTGERLTRETFAKYRAQGGSVIIHSRTQEMTRAAIEHPLTMIASDGSIRGGLGHPRTSGTYSKVLGKYVRELGALTLMDALRKMTIEPARRLQARVPIMLDKGRIRVGADADLTLFDPASVIDKSTYMESTIPADGIPYVLVNGVPVVDDGELVLNVRPGLAVRAEEG